MTAQRADKPVLDLLDNMGRDLEQGLFPLKAFADRGIYDLELRDQEEAFARTMTGAASAAISSNSRSIA